MTTTHKKPGSRTTTGVKFSDDERRLIAEAARDNREYPSAFIRSAALAAARAALHGSPSTYAERSGAELK